MPDLTGCFRLRLCEKSFMILGHYCPVELFRHRSNMITINRLEEY